MGEQEMYPVVEALYRYFDRARPGDDAYNAAISRQDLERYGGRMLLMAPAVIVETLRNAVMRQTLALHDDEAADMELQFLGLNLLSAYCSLIKAFGPGGVVGLYTAGLTLMNDEDVVALIGCALALLTGEPSLSPLEQHSLQSAVTALKQEFNKCYGTGCKVALAYALLKLGDKGPFRSFALPMLAPREQQRTLERLLGSRDLQEQQLVESLVLRAVVMDIASQGRAMPPGWRRPR